MNRPIAILLGVALLLSADAVFARGGRGGGGHAGGAAVHGGGTSMGFHGGRGGIATVGARFGHPVVRPFVGGRPGIIARPPFFHRHRVFVGGGTVIVGAPFFFPYPYYPYPAYGAGRWRVLLLPRLQRLLPQRLQLSLAVGAGDRKSTRLN